MLFGYARVSGADQNPAHQVDALVRAGIDAANIHTDHASGAKASRPQLDGVLARLRSGDTLVVTRLDRLGRSVLHLITLGAELRERGIGLKVLEQGIDTATAEGRAMFGMLSVLAELQRELIVANTRDGLAAARARGRTGGRPSKLSGDQIGLAQQLYDGGEKTVAQIAAILGVPRTTVYGHLNKRAPASSASAAAPEVVPAADSVAAVRSPRICPSCGYEPSTRAEAAHQRADLAVIWLHPHPEDPGSAVARSHCHQCEPAPPAFDVACTVCGDGPILAGDFAQTAHSGDGFPDPVRQWLIASGWSVVPELRCPDHT